jgi:hypothetical protein
MLNNYGVKFSKDLKVFRNEVHAITEIKAINIKTGVLFSYHIFDINKNSNVPYGRILKYSIKKLGYKNVDECLKTLNEKGLLGTEIDYKEQQQKEINGYLTLGVQRIKIAGRINTKDFENIIVKLEKYGMNYVDAQNTITENYLQECENKKEVF